MNADRLRELLDAVAGGRLDVQRAVAQFRRLPFEDVGYARLDHHRPLRCGAAEVIFGRGKPVARIVELFERLAAAGENVLATRVGPRAAAAVVQRFPEAHYDRVSRTLTLRQRPPAPAHGYVAVVAAGTSDLPVAEEARVTAEILDQPTRAFYDVGVAGLHRLLACLEALRAADALVVVAGMEGALPSVVGGLVDAPIIAVPTSVGYGASFGGLAALLGMLNSCAAGVTVVNIDNGFGAGFAAAAIGRRLAAAAARRASRANDSREDSIHAQIR